MAKPRATRFRKCRPTRRSSSNLLVRMLCLCSVHVVECSSFSEQHRKVLNQILRQSNTHLSEGPFAVLVDHTRLLDFDIKRKYFRRELEKLDDGLRYAVFRGPVWGGLGVRSV